VNTEEFSVDSVYLEKAAFNLALDPNSSVFSLGGIGTEFFFCHACPGWAWGSGDCAFLYWMLYADQWI